VFQRPKDANIHRLPHSISKPRPTRNAGELCGLGIASRRDRRALVWECVAVQHELAALRRSSTRCPRFRPIDRLFWMFMSWWWPASRDALKVIQPETDLRWRRHGIDLTWKYRSRGRRRGGRPGIARETRRLIREMAHANFLWGAPRIHGELLKLGTTVSQATVSRYMLPSRKRPSLAGAADQKKPRDRHRPKRKAQWAWRGS
jgi:hypothetical protein